MRNSTPEALELPSFGASSSEHGFLLHEAIYSKYRSFQEPIQRFELQKQTDMIRYDCLSLSLVDDILHVTLEWEGMSGSPRRVPFLRKGFSLQPYQWGRIMYNVRIPEDESWVYQKRVLNLGLLLPSSSRIFLETEPDHRYIDMVRLR